MLHALQFSQWISSFIFAGLLGVIPAYAALRKVKVYHSFVEGGLQAWPIILKIVPNLVAMLVALGMFRAAGGFEILQKSFGGLFQFLGVPVELLPQIFTRPLSAGAANAAMLDVMHTHGGDSLLAKISACISGSTETTFYVIAVYFGSVGISKARYAITTGLIADLTGVIASIIICNWIYS